MTQGERLKAIRAHSGLSMEKFGERIGMVKSSISNIENDNRALSDQLAKLIAKEYGVSETWLRTGEGEMLIPQTRDEQISDFMGKLLANPEDTFLKQFIRVLSGLSSDDIKVLAKISDRLMEEKEKDGKP